MITREELQEAKDRSSVHRNRPVGSNMHADSGYHDNAGCNERLLELLEAAEHYAQEDAMKETAPLDRNGTDVKEGDKVSLISDWSNWSSLKAGQVVTVLEIPRNNWISVEDEYGKRHRINAKDIERIEPDTQERIDDEMLLTATQYCDKHGLEPEGPKHRGMLKCEHLLHRQRELDKKMFGGE